MKLKINNVVTAIVETTSRSSISNNHSATHLLHAALREILGTHVLQKGSVVDANRLRFDFSHFDPIIKEQLVLIEKLVNKKIQENSIVDTKLMPIKEAIDKGAMALFDEKYNDDVRVVSMGGDFSIELCGGTHVRRTGDIGSFKITSEEGIAAGVRRIEAVTGFGSLNYMQKNESPLLEELTNILKVDKLSLSQRVVHISQQVKALEKELAKAKLKLLDGNNQNLLTKVKELKGTKILVEEIPTGDLKSLRELVDKF